MGMEMRLRRKEINKVDIGDIYFWKKKLKQGGTICKLSGRGTLFSPGAIVRGKFFIKGPGEDGR